VMLNEDNFLRPRTNFLNPKITYNITMHLVMKNIDYVYVIHPKIVTYSHDHELEHVYIPITNNNCKVKIIRFHFIITYFAHIFPRTK